MIYFETRTAARNFKSAAKNAAKYHVVDNGSSADTKRRWAVRIEK